MNLVAFVAVSVLSQSPVSTTSDVPAEAPVDPPSSSSGKEPSADAVWEAARAGAPWSQPSGTGVSIGYESGSWAGLFSQGIRVRVPLARAVSLGARGLFMGESMADFYRPNLGARLELLGNTPVFLNLMRLYGGGGAQVFFQLGPNGDGKAHWGGGGHLGFEFFLSHRFAFFLEVGGQGGGPASGATILAGMNVYPF